LSLDPEHREFEAKKEFGAACRDRRNQRRNKALLAGCSVIACALAANDVGAGLLAITHANEELAAVD